MNPLHAIILGIIEGLTEFFPISSTGHLIVAERLFKIANPSIVFNTVIQLGAILAVVVYYWKDILLLIQKTFQKDGWIIPVQFGVATVPVLILGFLLNKVVEGLHESTMVVGVMSIVVALLMLLVQKKYKSTLHSTKVATTKDYLTMGLFQAVSIIPGTSRSGITILGGVTRGLSFERSVEISFLLGIPAMGAASAFELLKVIKDPAMFDPQILPLTGIGFVIAMIVAFATLKLTLPILKKYGFMPFIVYRILMGIALLVFLR